MNLKIGNIEGMEPFFEWTCIQLQGGREIIVREPLPLVNLLIDEAMRASAGEETSEMLQMGNRG